MTLASLRAELDELWKSPHFRLGARDIAPACLGIWAWGLVTGVAMAKSGLSVSMAILMTFLVYAGTSQLAALPLMVAGAPLWLIWATAFCVNLRFLIYSVQWRPFLAHLPRRRRIAVGYLSGDLTYVHFIRRYPRPEAEPGQVAYMLGSSIVNWLAWQSASLVGILLAERIPTQWGIGFIGTIALLAVIYMMLTDRAMWIAAAVAAFTAVATLFLPWNLNIPLAIGLAAAAGLLVEQAMNRLRAKGF